MDADQRYFREWINTYLNENSNSQKVEPKKSSLLEKTFSKNVKIDIPVVMLGLYLMYALVLPLGITSVRNAEFSEGKKEGIELMKTIYNTQGGNEALRYTSYDK